MSTASELLVIGKITGTHGIKGMVKVHLYSGDDRTLRAATEIILRHGDGKQQILTVISLQGHGRKTLLTLKGYASITEALSLVGGELVARRDQFPEPDEDEYYWADLVGLRVVTDAGIELGTLKEIIETGSNDVYVCKGEEREILLPAIAEVIKLIDTEKKVMKVKLMEGL